MRTVGLLLFTCFSFGLFVSAQPIEWGTRTLTWDDFQGKPNMKGHKAETYAELSASYTADEDSLYFEVRCYFHPDRSWTREPDDDYLLNHEQRHFDLTEVYARRLRKTLTESRITVKNYKQVFSEAFKDMNRELYHMQQLYDKETRHSIYKDAQAKWDELIDKELALLEAYTDPIIPIAWP